MFQLFLTSVLPLVRHIYWWQAYSITRYAVQMQPSPVCSTALTEDLVQAVESALGEDDEATHVATRSQLQQVQALDRADLNTRQVPTQAAQQREW
jgi:hypothetical protein